MLGHKVIKAVLRHAVRALLPRAAYVPRTRVRRHKTHKFPSFLAPTTYATCSLVSAAQDILIIYRVRCGGVGRPWAALKGGVIEWPICQSL